MFIDGKVIQRDIKESLRRKIQSKGVLPHLLLIYVGESPVIDKYVALKEEFGHDIGVHVNVNRFPADIKQERLKEAIQDLCREDVDGIVIQLPLPSHIDATEVLNIIPTSKDIDVLSEDAFKLFMRGDFILPPVVGAVKEIIDRYTIELQDKRVVVIGRGPLVGKPVALWLMSLGIPPTILEKGDSIEGHIRDADIIITGAGSPNLITPEMIKENVILIDAGTSDSEGKTIGDIDLSCIEKASLFAPVPGGVGPITIAKLFENLCTLQFEADDL